MMLPKRWTNGVTAALAVSLGLGAAACKKDDPVTPPVSTYEAPTTPGAVLRNLAQAYETRNVDEYTRLFDADEFVFKFAEVDVNGDDPLPPSWNWADEELATRGLFGNVLVESIDLVFTFSSPFDPDPNEIQDAPDHAKLVWLTSLTLVITQDNPELGEQDILIVDGDRHEFFFREYPDERVGGEPIWRIVEWRDKSLGPRVPRATYETTWGAIKGRNR